MNLTFYGRQPYAPIEELRIGGVCPHCKTGSRFTLAISPKANVLGADGVQTFVASYACDNCLGPVPVRWHISSWHGNMPVVGSPKILIPSREPFEFEHVPDAVRQEIEEALACLSVDAWNGFAAVCRRAVQAICVNLGATASTKVKSQIEQAMAAGGLDDEVKALALEIMLAGHDGSHPHLPSVTPERASILLSLLRDLAYELYTRPGKIKKSMELRHDAVQSKKEGAS